jgi:hypothetical protein
LEHRTSHVLDFQRTIRRDALRAEEGDGLEFVDPVSVIEIQSQRVTLATVDARMRAPILLDKTSILVSAPSNPVDLASDVLGAISQVVVSAVSGVTRSAMALACFEPLVWKANAETGSRSPYQIQRRRDSSECATSIKATATKNL